MRLRDIYLYLADNTEVFDPEDAETYAVRDLDIVDVELSKNDEQSFWTAAVKVRTRWLLETPSRSLSSSTP